MANVDFSFAQFSEDGSILYAGISSEISAFDVRSGHALFSIENDCPPSGDEGYAYALLGSDEIAALCEGRDISIFDSGSGKARRRISLPGRYAAYVGPIHISSAPAAHTFAMIEFPPCPPKPAQIGIYSEQPFKLIRNVAVVQSSLGLAGCDWVEGASSIELARDGRHLAVRGWTSRSPSHVLIFDTDSGEQVGSFDAEANFVLQAASLSPDGTQLVLAGAHETYEADRWESKATRSALEIRVYDWKSRRVVARGFAPLSWDNFGRVSMIPGGEIVVQLAGGVSCYVPDS